MDHRARITSLEITGVAVPLVGSFASATSSGNEQRSAIVRLRSGDGAEGIGNCDPSPGYSPETIEETLRALEERLGPAVLGLPSTSIHRVLAEMNLALAGFNEAKAAIEMACCDLSARRAGIPLHDFLGGAVRERVSFNAWIGLLSPAAAAAEALLWQERGYRSAKIKVGGDLDPDVSRVRAVREAVGPAFRLRVDGNTSYDLGGAIMLAERLAPLDLELLEQPVAEIAELVELRRAANRIGLRIMADESVTDHASLIEIIRTGAADLVKLKAMKQGGLLSTRRMIETAAAAGLPCVIGHGFGLGVNTMAEIMLSATSANVIEGLECVGPLKTSDDITDRRLDLTSGSMPVPDGVGLAVTLDAAKIERYRFHAARLSA
ncbi:MAG: hypothetical protein IT557_00130 [Alphaproteobacteria bacterium]|nr:hypothetical protein [Alphaproteobacteria bacterium]